MKKNIFFTLFIVFIGLTTHAQNLSLSKSFLHLESTIANSISASDTLTLNFNSFSGDLNIVTAFPFEVSDDGLTYNDTLVIPNSLSNTNILLYVRFRPNQANIVFRNALNFQDGIFTVNKKVYLMANSIPKNESISICSWNIKWFGLASQCNCDTALSRRNATQIMKEINADVFAIQEMVSEIQLQKVVNDLGPDYDYVLSDYCSQISNSGAFGYTNCQKLAYVYNKQRITNNGTFGLARSTYPAAQSSSSPYYYYASGRWPFVMKAKVNNSSNGDVFNIVNIHGKAYSGSTDHNRRAGGALIMTDSLNAHFSNEKVVVIGDYNDLLEGAITNGFTVSPYNYMLSNGFRGITLPSLFPGEFTYIGSPGSLIDNVVVSDNTYPAVIPNATTIIREADFAIENYRSTTSDHLPLITYLNTNIATSINYEKIESRFKLAKNGENAFSIFVPKKWHQNPTTVKIYSLEGKMLYNAVFQWKERISISLPHIAKGIFIVHMANEGVIEKHKWLNN